MHLAFAHRRLRTLGIHGRAGRALLLTLCASALPVQATVPLDGSLVADRDCLASVSTKRPDQGQQIRLEPGHAYRLLGKNKEDATHYQVVIDGGKPPERWVEVGCGTPTDAPSTTSKAVRATGPQPTAAAPAKVPTSPEPPARSKPGAFVFALTWQPAFCEIHRRKPECRDQTPRRPDASRFSLHGLWPQPRDNAYCGVGARSRQLDQRGDWSALPALDLSPATRERLDAVMPGTRSGLDRHEWFTHGTCYGTDADTYFSQAMALAEQINDSPIRALFADNRGRHLSSNEVRAAFDAAFGRGIGERVRLICTEGMISELRLSLKGQIGADSPIGPLMQAAPTLSPRCRGGRVDTAGFE